MLKPACIYGFSSSFAIKANMWYSSDIKATCCSKEVASPNNQCTNCKSSAVTSKINTEARQTPSAHPSADQTIFST